MSPDTSMPSETSQTARPPVVVVTGPTCSGKSALAIEMARRFGGEVVNADSMQVFRYMDIGTAKPSIEERTSVPHHLFDVANPDEIYSAGRYAKEARETAAQIHARDRVVFLTGGTGLYIRAFLDGLVETGAADRALRERLEAEHVRAAEEGDPGRLHRRLAEFDPDAADKIHINDVRRTVRALEIIEQSGQTASSMRGAHAFTDRPFRVLHLAIDPGRPILVERIDRRAEAMIEAGLLREVRGLRERGYGPELRPMQAIGYRHIQPVVDGSDTLVNALEGIKIDTRRFARRQITWLRRVADLHWHDPSNPANHAALFGQVESFLEARESRPPTPSAPEEGALSKSEPTSSLA